MRKLLFLTALVSCVLFTNAVFGQKVALTGRVTDPTGGYIPGASIKVKNSRSGTIADNFGAFRITVDPGTILVITATGYKQQEVVAKEGGMTVSLEEENKSLSEVIVTAQGIRKRPKELGYSVAKITPEDIVVGHSPQLAASLSGKVSGLAVYNVNNSVDPSVKIVLRGYRSITGDNNALIVLDGLPLPRESSSTMLSALNPNDVESVTVLKGGVAATLYGSDGVNGALVITTKRGSKGRARVTFSNSSNIEQVNFYAQYQDKYGSGSHYAASYGATGYKTNYLDRMKDNWRPFENQQFGDPYNGELRIIGRTLEDSGKLILPYAPIDNVRKDIWDVGFTVNNQASISGGTDNNTFYLSLENNITHGIVPKDKSMRSGVRFAASTETGRFRAGFNAAYVQTDYDRTTFDFYNETINQAAHVPVMRNWQSDKFAHPNGYYNDYYNNPFFQLDNNRTDYGDANISGNLELNLKLTNWLNLYDKIGGINNNRTTKNTTGKFIYNNWAKNKAYVPAPWQWANDYNGINRARTDVQGSVYDADYTENVVNNELQAQLNKDFGDFTTRAILGYSIYRRKTKLVEVSSSSIVVPDVYNVVNRQGELGGGESFSEYRKLGYYADITGGWKNMIFLNALARLDASSKFYKNDRAAELYQIPYYGADLSAVVTELIPNIRNKVLDYFKVRVGYNTNGVDNLGGAGVIYGLDLSYSNASGFPYGNTVGISVGDVLPDSKLKPEIVKTFETGAEVQLFNNRINVDFTWYTVRSEGQVISVRIPNSTGFSNLRLNVGDMKNWGYEVDLKTQIVKSSKFNFDFNVRYSNNENKVLQLSQNVNEFQIAGYSYASSYVVKGDVFPVLKAIPYVRDPATGRVIVNATTGYPLTNGALRSFGRTTPKHILGSGIKLNYSNITLMTNFEYRGGNVMYSDLGRQMTFTGSGKWTENRAPHIFPNSAYDDGTGKFVANTSVNVREAEYALWADYYRLITENFVFPAWFIKMRDVSLMYAFPKSFMGKTKIFSDASIGVYGRNLFMIVDDKNFYTDPEFSFTAGNGLGVSNTAQTPPTRQFGINLNLTFK
jgi:TonB-linked SusC/RagA family outer membrane protein